MKVACHHPGNAMGVRHQLLSEVPAQARSVGFPGSGLAGRGRGTKGGYCVSQSAVTYPDTDTPKGTALMSWWPTLEWPDGRQR
jgi:hypothetical protein